MFGRFFKDGRRIRQEEDLNFDGKIDARYIFKQGKVVKQEQVAELEPKFPVLPFSSVRDEVGSTNTEAKKGTEGIVSKTVMEQKRNE